jgi:hypothetical protein
MLTLGLFIAQFSVKRSKYTLFFTSLFFSPISLYRVDLLFICSFFPFAPSYLPRHMFLRTHFTLHIINCSSGRFIFAHKTTIVYQFSIPLHITLSCIGITFTPSVHVSVSLDPRSRLTIVRVLLRAHSFWEFFCLHFNGHSFQSLIHDYEVVSHSFPSLS